MTKEELLRKTNPLFTMKDLRRFVRENEDLMDDAPILVERVTDNHFESRELNGVQIGGWDVLKVEGYHYHSSLEWNEKMQAEIERRERGEEPEYEMDNPSEFIFAEKQLEGFLDWVLSQGIRGDEKLEIDRIDSTKGYYPENCRFITKEENILRSLNLSEEDVRFIRSDSFDWSLHRSNYNCSDITLNNIIEHKTFRGIV